MTNSLPAVNVKTYGTYNTFTNECNDLSLDYSAKNGEVRKVEFVNGWAVMDEDGSVSLNNGQYSGKVRFFFECYNDAGYVEKNVSFKTVKTTPKYKLDTTSLSLYVPEGSQSERMVSVHLLDGLDIVDLSNATVMVNNEAAEIDGNTIRFSVSGKGKYTIYYKENGWNDYLKYSVSVSVTDKLPSLKVINTVTLNKKYNPYDEALLVLSDTSMSLCDMALSEDQSLIEGLSYSFEDGKLYFEADDSVPNKTYTLKFKPVVKYREEEITLKEVSVKVKVEDSNPSLSFGKSSVTLNSNYDEVFVTTYKLTKNSYNAELTGFKCDNSGLNVELDGEEVYVYLNEGNNFTANKNTAVMVTPVYNGNIEGMPVKLSVKRIDSVASVTISLKGKLNKLAPETEVTGTVKLKNTILGVIDVKTDNSDVKIELRDGKLYYSLLNNNVNEGKLSLKTTLILEDEKEVIVSTVLNVERKAPSVKLETSTVKVYDITSIGETVASVNIVGSLNGAEIAKYSYNNSNAYKLDLVKTDDGYRIDVILVEPASIKAGSKVSFTVKIDWNGDIEGTKGLKSTNLKLTVQDTSYSVKVK